MKQLYFFTSLALKRKGVEQINSICGLRAAVNADAEGFEKYLDLIEAEHG